MKKYRIHCKCDPYHSARHKRYAGCDIVRLDGATPVEWVCEDGEGWGFTLHQARQRLNRYYNYAKCERSNVNPHPFFEKTWSDDIWTYSIEEMPRYVITIDETVEVRDCYNDFYCIFTKGSYESTRHFDARLFGSISLEGLLRLAKEMTEYLEQNYGELLWEEIPQ